jgi:hypothetical protein
MRIEGLEVDFYVCPAATAQSRRLRGAAILESLYRADLRFCDRHFRPSHAK